MLSNRLVTNLGSGDTTGVLFRVVHSFRRLVRLRINRKSPLTNETLHERQYKHTRDSGVSTIYDGLNMGPDQPQVIERKQCDSWIHNVSSSSILILVGINYTKDRLLMSAVDERD